MVLGSNPGCCMQRKSAVFLFSFFLRKEKSNNKILLSLIRPRVFKDSGIFFSSSFPRYRQIIGAPRGDILFLFSPACRENAFSDWFFPWWRWKQKLSDAFSCSFASLHKKIQLVSLIFANFDAENALRGKRVKFSKKTRKVNFLILDPLCRNQQQALIFKQLDP